jgi:hypothetical protein
VARKKYTKAQRGLGPREVAAKENWPTDIHTGERRPPSPRTLLGDVDYNRLIKTLQLYPTNKDAAAALGVSDRTLRRYLHEGIPPNAKLSRKKLAAVHSGARRRAEYAKLKNAPIIPRKIPIHRHLGGTQTDTIYIEGMGPFDVLEILYKACLSGLYMTYSITLKFDIGVEHSITGWFEPETGRFIPVDSKEWNETKKNLTRSQREGLSLVTILNNHPFVATRPVAVMPGNLCDPAEYEEQIHNAFNRPYMRPVSIVFYKPRAKLLMTDEQLRAAGY